MPSVFPAFPSAISLILVSQVSPSITIANKSFPRPILPLELGCQSFSRSIERSYLRQANLQKLWDSYPQINNEQLSARNVQNSKYLLWPNRGDNDNRE